MIQVNRIYLIFNRLVTKKFLVDTSDRTTIVKKHFSDTVIGHHSAASETVKLI